MRELALFAGAGGGILGGHLLGWRTVCAVEIGDYPRCVLLARQRDGMLPRFPIWDDVTTFDGRPWRGRVDVISGGFPCQDISLAGKGAGITGAKSGLWKEFARIIGEVRPRFVFVENSPALKKRGLDVVLADLSALGYDAVWGVVGAHNARAPHKRDRLWILGYPMCAPREWLSRSISGAQATQRCTRQQDGDKSYGSKYAAKIPASEWWGSEPAVGRVARRSAHWVDRTRCIGNVQVPAVAAIAWRILFELAERSVDE